MASEKEREAAAKTAAAEEEERFAAWVKLHGDAGYTVVARDPRIPIGMDNVIVQGLPEGPVMDVEVGT